MMACLACGAQQEADDLLFRSRAVYLVCALPHRDAHALACGMASHGTGVAQTLKLVIKVLVQ